MESDSKGSDATINYVLDYYKKYSQNKELPKYFSGTSVSYLPEIKDVDTPETEVKSLLKTDINIIITTEEELNEEPADTSRASSAMSNRRLEWDNGADIGYDNCQEKRLRKSLSLPTIADELQKRSDVDFIKPVKSDVAVTKSQSSSNSSEENVKIVLLSCSSSSEYHSDENDAGFRSSQFKKKEVTSTSSSNTGAVPKSTGISISSSDSSSKRSLKQFASTLSYLKQKIGVPDAHSTPKFMDGQKSNGEVCSSASISKKPSSNVGENRIGGSKSLDSIQGVSSESISKKLARKPSILSLAPSEFSRFGKSDVVKRRNKKIVNLAVTKPITVECTGSNESLKHKSLQMVAKQSNVAVQTDKISERDLAQIIRSSQRNSNNQSLIYFEYSESDKTNTCSSQTNSEVIESNCESFEYLKKSPPELKTDVIENKLKATSKSEMFPDKEQISNLKRAQKTYDLRSTPAEGSSEPSSGENLVPGHLLGHIEEDIGKSVYILQRLLKSKKYDSVTKRHYIKKIIKRITESKYFEESSASSDLFVPKKFKSVDLTGDRNVKNSLETNVPWYPATIEDQIKLESPSRRKKLVQKTFTQDFLPQQQSSKEDFSSVPEIVPINSRDTRKNPFTLTNNEFLVNHRYRKSVGSNKSETDSTSMEKQYESSSTSNSYQNWKEDKTLSEKILEKHSKNGKSRTSNGNGDCLVKFADKERQFQISWINNEISHLGKLKGLLEKPKSASSKSNDTPSVKKITNVYTVSNENDPEWKPKRNYIIETLLGAQSSSEMNFQLNGQVYTVQETLNSKKKKGSRRPRQVAGNIEVVSSDSTTNIKVTTFCGVCKRSPCICKLQDSEEGCSCDLGLGDKCDSDSCVCEQRGIASAPLLGTNICCKCKQFVCVCVSSSSSSTRYDSTCCFCKSQPCTCDTKYNEPTKAAVVSKDDISGTFIPAFNPEKFSTFPSTSKSDGGRNDSFKVGFKFSDVCCKCNRYVCICGSQEIVDKVESTVSKNNVALNKDQAHSYGSLRRVFENCACTQTNCTCDFVEKLINRFSRTDSLCFDNKCMQTDTPPDKTETQTVALQTRVDAKNENQQTDVFPVGDKSLQTDKDAGETVGVQTHIETDSAKQQTLNLDVDDVVQTKISRLEENLQDIGIQAKRDMKDEILQTSRSIGERFQSRGVSIGNENQRSVSTFSDNFTKVADVANKGTGAQKRPSSLTRALPSVTTYLDQRQRNNADSQTDHSEIVNSVGTSSGVNSLKKQKGSTVLPTVRSAGTSPHNVAKRDENTSASIPVTPSVEDMERTVKVAPAPRRFRSASWSPSVDNTKMQKDAATSPNIRSSFATDQQATRHGSMKYKDLGTFTSLETIKRPQDAATSSKLMFTENIAKPRQSSTVSQTIPSASVTKIPDRPSKSKDAVASQKAAGRSSRSATSQPTSSSNTSSRSAERREKKVLCICCCTQTDSKSVKSRKDKTPVRGKEKGTQKRGGSVATSSTPYEICPSILASSYNDTSRSITEDTSTTKSSLIICVCCDEKYPTDQLSFLGNREEMYPLCCNCLAQRPILTAVCYAGPEENCPCSKPSYTATMDVSDETTKKTTEGTDSNNTDGCCTCTRPFRNPTSSGYCSYCRYKLRNTARSKNGIAYTLTLQNECLNKVRRKRKKMPALEEIRVKVPCPSSKKMSKDKENFSKRNGDADKKEKDKCPCGGVICTSNCHVNGVTSKHRKDDKKNSLTLQEHLKKNRPDFIESAESRRNVVSNSKSERELGQADAKLRFAEENIGKHALKKKKKLFTEQEMKEINKRNYKKLPEVKEKINSKREERLRNADRFIVDVFTKKIQRSVLKGKRTFPIDANVICLPKHCNC